MNSRIKIFITGGTFDKEYNELTGELYFKNTHMYELLELGRSQVNVDIETLMMVDSLKMSVTERQYIIEKCVQTDNSKIVITHGTDTMVETARILAENTRDKTIVLTGAMIPFKFGSSDGLFNMGSALSFVQALDNGVYIAMNGQIFSQGNVRKNKKLGIFEELETTE
ncbi:MAG: asparaginase domain-containing protein [Candidatus Marinimicrobia bacterium]|nr:asparaginase domain-containing protein [Candidatus Neomarinimicrobiota bacterium]MDP6853447.1 asparaginase domain-containing protein [Candidatus Neomarinimicrobiota bacterium]MDP6936786.1 asparaginase domain-containing protein [Candidatus Neomarinimicrobiota bacterium]